MHYCADRRPALKKEQPDLKATAIIKVLAEEWKGLADAKKAKWISASEEAKERYSTESEEYTNKYDVVPKATRTPKATATKTTDKKTLGAAPKTTKVSAEATATKTTGKKTLGAAPKTTKVSDEATATKTTDKKTLGAAPKTTKVSDEAAAKQAATKRLPMAYNIYYKETFPQARAEAGAGAKATDAAKIIGRKWKELADDTRAKYVEAAAAAKQDAALAS